MKTKFNFLQIANWIYICLENLKKINNEQIPNSEKIKKLIVEKKKFSMLKDILNKKFILHGINNEFIKNIKNIKKQYEIED